ncbi:hypothetical protein LOD99_7309 [Oopsacas minuta]|uniref:Proton-coupled folate transporter n=1 Tax=Oopsacas minuta TaxID=111878 RepID=A0AAV7JUP2_9METZ|nr:hypothetical protein LOD99_7309 [Oopsacas minuta]
MLKLTKYRKYLPPDILLFFFMLITIYIYIIQQQFIYYRVCKLIARNSCNYTFSPNETSDCTDSSQVDKIQSLSSYLYLASNLATSIPSIFTSLILGPLTDIVGRKIAIYTPIIAHILSVVCMICVNYLNLHPYYIIIGSLISGLGGHYSVMILSLSASVVDSVSARYRVVRLAILETSITFASFAGNFSGGLILEIIHFNYFFVLNIILLTFVLIYSILLKETVQRKNIRFSNISIKKSIIKCITIVFKPFRLFCTNKEPLKFTVLVLAFAFSLTAIFGTLDLFTLYALGPPMCWLPHLIGYFFAFNYLGAALGIMLILPILIKFKISDYILIALSSLDIVIVYILIGTFQTQLILLVAVPIIGCLRMLTAPSVKSALSSLITPKDHGSLFALFSIETVLVQLVSSAIFNAVYPTLRIIYPGLSFYIVAAGSIIPIAVCIILYVYDKCCAKERKISIQNSDKGDEEQPLINSN